MHMSTSSGYLLTGIYVGIPPPWKTDDEECDPQIEGQEGFEQGQGLGQGLGSAEGQGLGLGLGSASATGSNKRQRR